MNITKLKHFLQYNNAALLLVVLIFLIGGSVLAAPLGKEALGSKITKVEGADNTLLLHTDLNKFDMHYKIEAVKEDSDYYYVTFTFDNLDIKDNVWQLEAVEATRKVTKKLNQDLGQYIAGQLKDEYEARIAELKAEQAKAEVKGEEKQVQVEEYSGLIGKVLNVAKETFPNYEPVKKIELPSPQKPSDIEISASSTPDNMTKVYSDYVGGHIQQIDNLNNSTASSTLNVPEVPVVASTTIPVANSSSTNTN